MLLFLYKKEASIKMTGVTTLTAPNQWTSFIEAKDNDDFKSMTGVNYDASTDDAVRKQKTRICSIHR